MQGYLVVKETINWAELMEEIDEAHIEQIRWYSRIAQYSKRTPPLMLYDVRQARNSINQDF